MKFNNSLELIGNTPLVRLNKVTSDFKCKVWAKCEFLNPGGSIKDRIALSMIEKLENEGRLKNGSFIIEPTSGNTGIGLALVGAVKGYKVIIVMPEKMSKEKEVILKCLGAEIIRTPTEEPSESPNSHIGICKRISQNFEHVKVPDQYSNKANPEVHYSTTAEEILRDLNFKVDMFVASPGTGGTLTGVAKKLKEVNPNCIVVGADPYGSILGGGTDVHPYQVEGIGYDFFPDVFDPSLINYWVKVSDRDCFLTAREIIRNEGLLVGGSSGANLFAAKKYLNLLGDEDNCVVIFPDGIRNYLSKFAQDDWLFESGLYDIPNEDLQRPISDFKHLAKNLPTVGFMNSLKDINISSCKNMFVVEFESKPFGVLCLSQIAKYLLVHPELNRPVFSLADRKIAVLDYSTSVEKFIQSATKSTTIIKSENGYDFIDATALIIQLVK